MNASSGRTEERRTSTIHAMSASDRMRSIDAVSEATWSTLSGSENDPGLAVDVSSSKSLRRFPSGALTSSFWLDFSAQTSGESASKVANVSDEPPKCFS